MVVLSAAVVTSSKALVARQFVEMSRLRVEGLISSFQQLVGSGRDHTFIETETVRYVYQPMESLRLVVITNKSSNMLEDLGTLGLLAKVMQECCQTRVSEEVVLRHSIDIVLAWDEVISFGHRESVTLSQVRSFIEMDSHEEKLHLMIQQEKVHAAQETAKRRERELANLQKDEMGSRSTSSIARFGSSDSLGSWTSEGFLSQESRGDSKQTAPPAWAPLAVDDSSTTVKPHAYPKTGMKLGRTKLSDVCASLGGCDFVTCQEPVEAPVMDPELVKIMIQEKVTANLGVEGSLIGNATCSGSFEVSILDPSKAGLICVKLAPQLQDLKYVVHPHLNKASHSNGLLQVRKDQSRFPTGECLKWQLKTSDDSFLPVAMSCWLTALGDGTHVIVELEFANSSAALENISIRFPAPASSRPSIASVSLGDAEHTDRHIVWRIPMFDSNADSGKLEFVASADAALLLPARFEATEIGSTKCPMDVLECHHQESEEAIPFVCMKKVAYELNIGR
eukprot:CAMPEP_0115207660 /NCGR_PEP_ID=MMETSP0270-20121206/20829_1 /TAXON_ID=71861 /ORGANISM="Scrippsiella trochoidea, Strain CCMP3099" /LENGTH=507 /DNA_ID=CAMNT_0002621257 /DNA_START=102 /DNA_END=1625 /DNA_ORIENTATION=+